MNRSHKSSIKDSDAVTVKNVGLKNKLLKRVGQVALSLVSGALVIGSAGALAGAIDAAETAQIASEGGKEALNQALKVARSKPAISVAAGITCLACLPAAGVVASPSLCITCGILIAKVIG